jgi:inorganic pyrophosphatase
LTDRPKSGIEKKAPGDISAAGADARLSGWEDRQMAKDLQEMHRFEIQAYRKPTDVRELRNTHVAFSGSLRKHHQESDKIILVSDPYSANTFYYEFAAEHISYAEELPNLVTPEGEAIRMVRIWVKKGCIAVRSTPFVVADTRI